MHHFLSVFDFETIFNIQYLGINYQFLSITYYYYSFIISITITYFSLIIYSMLSILILSVGL